jgi:hypothetical protein
MRLLARLLALLTLVCAAGAQCLIDAQGHSICLTTQDDGNVCGYPIKRDNFTDGRFRQAIGGQTLVINGRGRGTPLCPIRLARDSPSTAPRLQSFG